VQDEKEEERSEESLSNKEKGRRWRRYKRHSRAFLPIQVVLKFLWCTGSKKIEDKDQDFKKLIAPSSMET